MRLLLGTFVEVGVAKNGQCAQRAIAHAFELIESVQRSLSFQDPDSELSRLNRIPGEWVPMSPLALRVLRLARAMGVVSGDGFNSTVGGQMVRWGVLPDHLGDARLPIGCSRDIELRPGAARLSRAVLVTLDGIAKGFAVDTAIAALVRRGMPSAWVNAGGDVRTYGERGLDMQRREVDGSRNGLVRLQNNAVASSFASVDAQPDLPGRMAGVTPEERGSIITVLARHAWKADALTKVAGAVPRDNRQALVSRFGATLLSPGT